jgi:hypothetical protein
LLDCLFDFCLELLKGWSIFLSCSADGLHKCLSIARIALHEGLSQLSELSSKHLRDLMGFALGIEEGCFTGD